MAASGNISYFLMNVRLLLKDINVRLLLKENVQLIFFICVAASKCISMFFNERAAASEKILRKNVRLLLKENVQLLLRIMST